MLLILKGELFIPTRSHYDRVRQIIRLALVKLHKLEFYLTFGMLVCNFIIELKVIEVEVEGFIRDFDTLVVLDEGKRDFIKLGVYNLSGVFLHLLF
jgi:hypothetical protein